MFHNQGCIEVLKSIFSLMSRTSKFVYDIFPGGIPTTQVLSTTTKAPSTTTKAPSTTTKAPSTTTKAPSTTTKAPSITTKAPSITTKAPSTTTNTPSTTTKAPSTTTKAPSTTTKAPSTTTKASSTTTKAPSTTTNTPSTTTNKPSTTTNKPSETTIKSSSSTTTNKMNILDGDKENQSAGKTENVLSISVIVVGAVVCLMLIIIATFFVSKWKKSRAAQRDGVLNNSNGNECKAANAYIADPTNKLGAFSIHGGNRPLPERPPNATNQQSPSAATIDIKTLLRKQSIDVPASFSNPALTQHISDEREKSVRSRPELPLRPNRSGGALSIRNPDARVGDVSIVDSNDFIAMNPIQCKYLHAYLHEYFLYVTKFVTKFV